MNTACRGSLPRHRLRRRDAPRRAMTPRASVAAGSARRLHGGRECHGALTRNRCAPVGLRHHRSFQYNLTSNKSSAFTCSIFQLYAHERAERGMARVSAACFGVHCFAENAIVNSPLHCWALDAERERLWKSLCARRNTLFTVARRACAITRSNCRGISFSAPTAAARWRLSDRQRAHDLATGYLRNCRALAQRPCRDLRLVSLAE